MALILFGVFILLLLIGVPVGFSICSAAAATMFAGYGDAKMMIVAQRMFASCDSFSLIAVPFFIFAGDLLAGGKIAADGKAEDILRDKELLEANRMELPFCLQGWQGR